MNNTIKLSVHKNTLQKRREKNLRKGIINDAKSMSHDMVGYCIITWNQKGQTACNWVYDDDKSPIRSTFLGSFVKDTIQRRINSIDINNKLNGE